MKIFILFFQFVKDFFYFPIVNTLFPNFCWKCDKVLSKNFVAYCEPCFSKIPRIQSQKHCIKCSSIVFIDADGLCSFCRDNFLENVYYSRNISCFSYYEEEIQKMITTAKYSKRKSIWKLLAHEMINFLKTNPIGNDYIIIPVPISKKRYYERGFNQSLILAQEISKNLSLLLYTNVLIKIKDNRRQTNLKLEERKKNPLDCYQVKNSGIIENKNILLIDDVFTTGSTVNECSRLLKQNGVNKIISMTIAKTDLK